jgi:hypothetical protein
MTSSLARMTASESTEDPLAYPRWRLTVESDPWHQGAGSCGSIILRRGLLVGKRPAFQIRMPFRP